jgi:hypothetical protein
LFRTKLIAVVGVATALITLGMSAASASTTASKPSLVKGTENISSIACPTSGRCVAFASDTSGVNMVSVLINAVSGSAAATKHVFKNTSPLGHVACSTSTTCFTSAEGSGTGISNGVAIIKVSASTGAMTVTGKLTHPKNEIVTTNSVSCQGTAACWFAGWVGSPVGTATGELSKVSASGKVLSVRKVTGTTSVNSISCESKTACLLDEYSSKTKVNEILPLVNGKLGKSHALPAGDYLGAISCYGTKLCYAAGGKASKVMLWPLNPKTGAPGKAVSLGSSYYSDGLDCYSATQCITAGGSGSAPATVVITKGKAGKVVTYSSGAPRKRATRPG